MRISALGMQLFGRYRDLVTLSLPDSGVVLLTGDNGSGKSTILNAVSWAIWGKTLSGARYDSNGTMVTVGGPWGGVDRVRGASAAQVSCELGGVKHSPFTASAGNRLIEDHLGSWATWHRAHVLSSSEGRAFGTSSDAERKALLEEILGLGRFDRALDLAKADAKEMESQIKSLELGKAGLIAEVKTGREFLESKPALGPEPAMPPMSSPVSPQDAQALRDAWIMASNELSRACMTLERANQSLKAAKLGICGECAQPRPTADLAGLQEAVNDGIRAVAQRETDKYEAKRRLDDAQVEHRAWQAAHTEWRTWYQDQERAKAWSQAEVSLAQAEAKLAGCQVDLGKLAAKQSVLKDVLVALGPRGARVMLMEQAVQALNEAANYWLVKLGLGPVDLVVGDNFKVDIQVPWRGGTYTSLSGGERRRLDLAFQLGLSQMAGGNGTLWLDEAFDALDAGGARAAAEMAHELAEERCVVVISHNPVLQASLKPDLVVECPLR